MACQLYLEELPDDALQHVCRQLSTDARRTLSLTSRKWQRHVAESWDSIDIRLGGANYLDSASKQVTWLLSLQLQHLQRLTLDFKDLELSGIAVDYLLFPLLDALEQGAMPELQSLKLSADMSLPGPLIHKTLQHVHLDMYALTAMIQCPQLLTLRLHMTSMPGPTLFSQDALLMLQQIKKLQWSFHMCCLDDPNVSWFMLKGLSILTALQHVVLDLPGGVDVTLSGMPAFPVGLVHLEMRSDGLSLSFEALLAMRKLESCLLGCDLPSEQIRTVTDAFQRFPRGDCSIWRWKSGLGPFALSHFV